MEEEIKRISEEKLDYYRNNIEHCPVDILRVLYKEKEESEKYLYDAYQDAGKKMFEYAETIDKAKEFIEKILSNGNGANCGDLQMLLDILGEE